MTFKLMSEAGAAWVAIILSTGGGLVTTAIHWGSTSAQIHQMQEQVAKHEDELHEIEKQNAATEQALTDIKDAVHDIQDHVVSKPAHDGNIGH